MARLPCARCVIRPDLEQDEIILAAKVLGHLRKCFPINSFVVDAESAPRRFVLEDLVKQTCDARSGFARACVAGDQPTAAEIVSGPAKTRETNNDVLFGFPQNLNDQTRCCAEAAKSSDSCDETRTHRRLSINTPATAPNAAHTQCVMKRARLMRLTLWPNRRNS